MTPPKPGSDEAREQGCKCPRIDNHYGKGRGGDGEAFGWYVSSVCEVHRVPMLDSLMKAVGHAQD